MGRCVYQRIVLHEQGELLPPLKPRVGVGSEPCKENQHPSAYEDSIGSRAGAALTLGKWDFLVNFGLGGADC